MGEPATLPAELEGHVDLARLAQWLEAKGVGAGPITRAAPLSGGTQNIMLRITQDGRRMVLRRTPPHPRPYSNTALRREARVLGALAGTTVPHPTLIAAEPDESVLGGAFLLMEVVEGFNPGEGLPAPHRDDPALRRRMGESYIDALAALAEVNVQAVGLDDFGKPEGFLARQVPQWLGTLEGYSKVDGWPGPDALPGVARLADWLERHRPADAPSGLIHGDCHLANTLYPHESGEIAALIDWEMSTVGDPRLDLGWVMATWPDGGEDTVGLDIQPWDGFPSATELMARYAERTTRPLDAAPWFGAMACFKLGILLEGTFVRACAGKAPRDVGERLHAAAVALFRRGLRLIA